MKSLSSKLCLMAGISCLALLGSPTPVRAAADNPAAPADRLQQFEQRINQMADRQEQMMRRLDAALAAREQSAPQPGAPSAPPPPPGYETSRPALPLAGANHPVAAKILNDIHGMMGLVFLGCILFNLLLAFWIFTDIRKRGEGSGIFVALALVAGIPAAIIYSLVRIGDKAAAGGK
jgi:hypothetical protein